MSSAHWSTLATKLRPETAAAMTAFARRHATLGASVATLREAAASSALDATALGAYRSRLASAVTPGAAAAVAAAERAIASFTPTPMPGLAEQKDMLRQAEGLAVEAAKKTEAKIAEELKELKVLLQNIETARPIEELKVSDVVKAIPEIDKTVEKMVKRGQWSVPGYYEKFGSFAVGF